MSKIEDEIRARRQAVTAAQTRVMKAEVEKAAAQQKYDEADARLRDEFGLATDADVRARIQELQATIANSLQEIDEALEEAEA